MAHTQLSPKSVTLNLPKQIMTTGAYGVLRAYQESQAHELIKYTRLKGLPYKEEDTQHGKETPPATCHLTVNVTDRQRTPNCLMGFSPTHFSLLMWPPWIAVFLSTCLSLWTCCLPTCLSIQTQACLSLLQLLLSYTFFPPVAQLCLQQVCRRAEYLTSEETLLHSVSFLLHLCKAILKLLGFCYGLFLLYRHICL